MNKYLSLKILVIAGLVAATNAHSQEGKPMTEDQINVLATVQNMTNSFHAGEIDGVMNSYEKEAAVVFEPGEPITDPAVIEQMFKGAFKLNPKFTYSGHEVFVVSDIAIHFAPWEMSGKTPDGQEINQSGLSVAVLRKQANGNWLMVIDNPNGQHLMQTN